VINKLKQIYKPFALICMHFKPLLWPVYSNTSARGVGECHWLRHTLLSLDVNANPYGLFCNYELGCIYVLIISTAVNGLSTAALGAGLDKIKLTSFDTSGSASFSLIVMTYAICLTRQEI
jgi:hypothetical protein